MQLKYLIALPLAACLACNAGPNNHDAADTTTTVTSATDTVPADTPPAVDTTAASIKNYLAAILEKDLPAMDTADRKFSYTAIDLNGDGQNETFIGLHSPYFCGNAGCTVLLLAHDGRLITRFTIVRTPMVVLPEAAGGWRNLVADTKGGKHLMKWNGTKYPGNPSVQPAFNGVVPSDAVKVLENETILSF